MAIESLAVFLDQGVTRIVEGQKTLEQCLAECDDQRAELEPLFRIALTLAKPPVTPNPAHRARARERLISALRDTDRDDARDGPASVVDLGAKRNQWGENPALPFRGLLDNLLLFPRLHLVSESNAD